MSNTMRVGIAVALLVVVGVVIAMKSDKGGQAAGPQVPTAASGPADQGREAALPRLVDLGAKSCVPCKVMAPILEELGQDYAGRFDAEFIDVGEDRAAAGRYGIKLIPTQIFFGASGEELFRHEGFMSKEDILAKWDELGIEFGEAAGQKR